MLCKHRDLDFFLYYTWSDKLPAGTESGTPDLAQQQQKSFKIIFYFLFVLFKKNHCKLKYVVYTNSY